MPLRSTRRTKGRVDPLSPRRRGPGRWPHVPTSRTNLDRHDLAVEVVQLDINLARHGDGELKGLVRTRVHLKGVLRHRMHMQLVGHVTTHFEDDRSIDGRLRLA